MQQLFSKVNNTLFFNKKSLAVNGRVETPKTPQQQKHAHLVREAWWLGLVLIGVYLTVILFTYYKQDPSWSHMASDRATIHNAGGSVGAWVSDMLLYLFGFSALNEAVGGICILQHVAGVFAIRAHNF